MASSQEYLDYVRAPGGRPWTLRARKMFGDWMVYADDRPILLVCDNTVFIQVPAGGGAAHAGRTARHPLRRS